MPTLPVQLHGPGRTIPATLSTDHSSSSYGRPVLLLAPDDAGPSFDPDGPPIPHGPGDVTRHGVAAELPVEAAVEPLDGAGARLLSAWRSACTSYRAREGYDAPAATQGPVEPVEDRHPTTWGDQPGLEVVRDVLLPDNRLLRVARVSTDAENGIRVRLYHVPGDGVPLADLSMAGALDLLRGLEAAMRLPSPEGPDDAGTGEDR